MVLFKSIYLNVDLNSDPGYLSSSGQLNFVRRYDFSIPQVGAHTVLNASGSFSSVSIQLINQMDFWKMQYGIDCQIRPNAAGLMTQVECTGTLCYVGDGSFANVLGSLVNNFMTINIMALCEV